MRPLPGGDAPPSSKPRSRKSSFADASVSSSGPTSHVPTTFFMRTEDDLEQSVQTSRNVASAKRHKESNFGVQSLADTLEAAFGGSDTQPGDSTSDSVRLPTAHGQRNARRASRDSSRSARKEVESCKLSPPRAFNRETSSHSLSSTLSPLNAESRSPMPPSAMPSTPTSASLQSLKLSDEEAGSEEAASPAVTSGAEDEGDTTVDEFGSFPQLVMPSLQMPSRRPFTAKGKAMGKLKVLVAGQAGIGKTSLIRSIVHLCEDIVHVDPLSPSNSLSQSSASKAKSRKKKVGASGTLHITETHASTKSYPPWWSDIEESRVLRRRKSSTTDAVLERNLCFVDTPGYSIDASKAEDIGRVTDYVEGLLYQTTSVTSMDDSDLFGVVSGSGGIAVDVVLYLLPPRHDISEDIEFMQRLSSLTNLIPVIARSDTISVNELVAIKTSILARLQTSSIKPFFFGNAVDDALLAVQEISLDQTSSVSSEKPVPEPKEFPFPVPTYPYAVSSTLGSDADTMDASLLMSPDYVQPLLPSELAVLVERVFDPDSIAWLRHSAAKKFLSWRRRTKLPRDSFILQSLQQQSVRRGSASTSASIGLNGAAPNTSATSSIFNPISPSGVLVPQAGSPFYASNLHSPFPASSPSLAHTQPETLDNLPEFSLTRYHSASHGEQRFAEVRVAKWATDLQRSLRNEKDRYEELQRSERAKWLLERVGEEVASGNIVASPGGSPRADWAVVKRGTFGKEVLTGHGIPMYTRSGNVDSRDPLGLCDFSDEVRRRGFVFVKVLGGMSVLGAVMVTVVRMCGWETLVPEGGVWRWVTGQTE